MNFLNLHFLPFIGIGFLVFGLSVVLLEKKFFKVIKTYWFFKRSLLSYVSSFLYLAGMGMLAFSLLDFRGPEEKIKMEVPQDRTIILIDTSASMLAEDVKPSRLQKAVLVAKHFARKAVGQQLSIVAFAEIQKKIVPFTTDLDLIDSRLESLKNLRNHYGSSALSVAIQESIQYFQEAGGEARGNILILTDGEETAGRIDFKVPKDVHVAMVGIGTEHGGRIPLDDANGIRFGYKKEKGKDVITKLSESFFKQASADIPSAKYWLANSYSLPSEEIIEFFQGEMKKGMNQQDMTIRPVMMEWIVVPGLLCLILAYGLKMIRVFAVLAILFNAQVRAEEEEVKLSPETISKMDSLKRGELTSVEKVKLADELFKAGAKEEALGLFGENLKSAPRDSQIPPEAFLNYGTGLLEKGNTQEALSVYKDLESRIKGTPSEKRIKEIMDKNVVSAFVQQEQKKKEEQKKKDQEKKEGQDKNQSQSENKNDSQSNPQSGKDKKQEKGSGDQKDKKEDKKDKGDKKEEEPKDDESKDDKSQEPKPDETEKPKNLPPKKMPAKLKQLMSDDRQLQMKMIENGTRDLNKKKSRSSKDW